MSMAKILVFSNDPVARKNLEQLLRGRCHLAIAGILVDAQEILARHKPDLILLDPRMENGTSAELLKQLPACGPKPIVMMMLPSPAGPSALGVPAADADGRLLTVRELEKRQIFLALEHCEGNRTHAARQLGISIRTLRNKLRDYGVGRKADALAQRTA